MADNENTQDNQPPEIPAPNAPESTAGQAAPEQGVETAMADPIQTIASDASLDFLLDVPLQVSVELGRCQITISELLGLGKGSVLELEKVAGESLDFRVNNRLVARGEAVVVNDKFGVRLTDIISPSERVKRLK
jgi:flagellar motor switch protein FliN/FliY